MGAVLLGGTAWAGGDLAPPERIDAGGEAIDVDVGHAAPTVVDWDGDGLLDLLVGQFGQGKLRIYRNVGEAGAPSFEGFEVFQAGDGDGTVPSG
jgi:hypothetical protein